MNTTNNTVAGLAEKWRELAAVAGGETAKTGCTPEMLAALRAEAATYRHCARVLEAAFASLAPSVPPSVAGDAGELPALVKHDQVVRVRYYDARRRTCTAYKTGQEIGDALSRLATPEPGVRVDAAMVLRVLDWQPIAHNNRGTRLWQLLEWAGLPHDQQIAALTAALSGGEGVK